MKNAFYARIKVGSCDIAVPSADLLQAVDLKTADVRPLPRRGGPSAGALVGVIEFRGGVVPLVALERWLPLGAHRSGTASRVVLLRAGQALIAVEVDALMGLERIAPSAIRTLCHDSGEEELFDAVIPATQERPLLCLLKVERLMKLAAVWCEDAELALSAPDGEQSTAAAPKERSTAAVRHAVFSVGDERWAVPASAVTQVARTPTPELRLPTQRVCGIGSWDGRKIPLIDLHCPPNGANALRPWLAAVTDGTLVLGLVADKCDRLINLHADDILAAPGDALRAGSAMVEGLGMVAVLDVDRLFKAVPEASISRTPAQAARKTDTAGQPPAAASADPASAGTDGSDYLVFDADRPYAAPASGLVGVVALSDQAADDLSQGKPATVDWRGQTLSVAKMPRIDGGKSTFGARLAIVVKAARDGDRSSAIAVRSLTRWLPARSAQRGSMHIHSVGTVDVVTPPGWQRSKSLVVVDLAQMAYMID